MKKILVTGGSGLVGNGIKSVERFFSNEYEFVYVSSKDYNLYNLQTTQEMFDKIKQ